MQRVCTGSLDSLCLGGPARCKLSPVVINITDGEATDGDPSNQAEAVRSVSTADGPALIFTCHMSATQSSPIEYPDSEAGLPDQYSKQMFRMSSQLTPPMQSLARQQGLRVNEGSRGFVLNADMVALIRFLEIGTRPSNLR